MLRFQVKLLHFADDVIFDAAFDGGFVGFAFLGFLKGEDDVV